MTRTAAAPPSAPDATQRRRGLVLVAVAIVLTAANLRTAVSSVGPVLAELEAGLGVSSAAAGVVTTMPVLCFALIGFAGPPLAARFPDGHVLAGALSTMAAGLVLRAVVDSFPLFLVGTALAMVGGALGNVLLPGLVKRWFPERTGLLVGAYSASMAIGGAVAAVSTAPIAAALGQDGWRWALGIWAVLALAAALPWLVTPRRPGASRGSHRSVRMAPLLRSPLALTLAAFFGLQATQAYVVMGWSAQYLRDSGLSAATAGLLLGINSIVVIPVNAVVPSLTVRQRWQRPLLLGFMACYAVGWTGLWLAPRTMPWLWMSVLAVGMGTFSMVLTLLGLRARTPETVSALSTVTQGWGYVLAGAGPLLVGVLRGATGGYGGMFVLIAVATVGLTVTGWLVTRDRFVDDEVPGWSPAAVSPAAAGSPRG
ncbi:MFS transporter, CP family, cyanate transporter [Geodermatophilus saharensis]|uniref:MFS transporter, CP family, cyanate transporter n=1 Tax=Geodermatophilus saharensis TaxID=1137994 RepID=A0A239B2Y3_9ACTN|nr:MFS transporter [Geodermatophilus saharensis]SNS02217.1 MFS transporter, CP family, cyanate transporter [Geodermatophilus saharensis]